MMSLRNAENACSATSVSRRIDPGVDPITTALQLAFFVLFGVTVFQFLRNRGPLELSVMAIFGSFAALFALSFSQSLTPSIAPIARPVLVALLFAQPTGAPAHRPDPARRRRDPADLAARGRRGLGGGRAASAGRRLLGVPLLRSVGTLFAVFYFFAVEIGAPLVRAREPAPVRRRPGPARLCRHRDRSLRRLDPHRRPHGRRAAAGRAAADSTAVTRFLILIAALGYVAAFVPPGWFRRFINRAASFQLVRKLVTADGAHPGPSGPTSPERPARSSERSASRSCRASPGQPWPSSARCRSANGPPERGNR